MNKISPLWLRRLPGILGCVAYLSFSHSVVQARGPINLEIIKRDGYGSVELKQAGPNEFVVQGTANGRAVRLILDTGAAARNTILTNSFATYLRTPPHPIKDSGLSMSGKHIEHLRQGTLDSMVLGPVKIINSTVDFGSFEFLSRRSLQGEFLAPSLTEAQTRRMDADGFLGLGFLERCSAIIDLANHRLYLKPPGVGRVPQLSAALKAVGFAEANLQLTNYGLLADVSVNETSGKMVVDTGATLTVVDTRFAEQAKLKGYLATNFRMVDSAGLERGVSWADPASFKVGGNDVLRTRLIVEPTAFYSASGGKIAGLLGMDVIGQSWGIIDFAQHKLYFAAKK